MRAWPGHAGEYGGTVLGHPPSSPVGCEWARSLVQQRRGPPRVAAVQGLPTAWAGLAGVKKSDHAVPGAFRGRGALLTLDGGPVRASRWMGATNPSSGARVFVGHKKAAPFVALKATTPAAAATAVCDEPMRRAPTWDERTRGDVERPQRRRVLKGHRSRRWHRPARSKAARALEGLIRQADRCRRGLAGLTGWTVLRSSKRAVHVRNRLRQVMRPRSRSAGLLDSRRRCCRHASAGA